MFPEVRTTFPASMEAAKPETEAVKIIGHFKSRGKGVIVKIRDSLEVWEGGSGGPVTANGPSCLSL